MDDKASLLAVEYMIPKAALTLVMLVSGLLSAVGAPLSRSHLAAVVLWTAVRQFRVFGKGWGFDSIAVRDWLGGAGKPAT